MREIAFYWESMMSVELKVDVAGAEECVVSVETVWMVAAE
jgi:hypothetical protein